jgi:hypothetical protein
VTATRFTLILLTATLLMCFSWAVPASQPAGQPGEYQGRSAEWWAGKTTHWKKAAVKRGRTLQSVKRANRARIQMGANGVARGFLCIHSFEGSWTDPGKPHWGGLQMDEDFQKGYGREFYDTLGTADHWPPFVQLAVAMRAYYSGRGYGPWPNTRRMCGI